MMPMVTTESSQIIYGQRPQPARPWIFLIPVVACLIWSALPALKAVGAAMVLKWSEADTLAAGNPLESRRRIQKKFLTHNIYIPLEDITMANQDASESRDYLFVMRKNCGQGKIFVWVPLRFRLPLTGEKVREWCLNL